ncbi:MAG TPA: hypothetical protein VKU62_07940 [Thermoanaerobaculia bacterium]|nr:hypothetical protein [Thermoanaerobaculia bacterium]
MSIAVVLVVLAAALVLATALAFLPMRLLLSHMAANIQQFILRQRVRRAAVRQSPERRKESEHPS